MDLGYIYEARKPKKDEPTKDTKKKLYFWIVVAGILAAILVATAAYLMITTEKVEEIAPIDLIKDCEKTLSRSQDGELVIMICVKKDGSLSLVWQNMPEITRTVDIYRLHSDGESLELWRTVSIFGSNGSLELEQQTGSNASSYRFEIRDESGTVVWSSTMEGVVNTDSEGVEETTTTTTSNTTSAPQATAVTPPPTQTPPAPQTTSTITPPPVIPPENTSTSPVVEPPPDGQIIYYTPSGEISGTSTPQTASFWVGHVNKKIEIGWQNLPEDTTKIKVWRSESENSDYELLLTQQDPKINSDYIRLDDHTISTDHYYKMELYAGTSLTQTYGPLLLEGLAG